MHQNRLILLSILMLPLFLASCIKAFDPQIKGSDSKKYVVMGRVSTADTMQTVNVSLSSPISRPQYEAVNGCTVTIMDDRSNKFPLYEVGNGDYIGKIDPSFMFPGASFMVEVIVPDGTRIISDYDQMQSCPNIDSVYFEIDEIEGNAISKTKGIQFYIDLEGSLSDSREYLFEAVETWEYHSDYPLEWYYDGTVHHVVPPDYSKMVCWRTEKIPEIFTLNTKNLSFNASQRIPLHFVNNLTSRLLYGYSLLVKQIALSEAGYTFWDQMRLNSTQDGSLYGKQPIAIRGNLQNTSSPDSEVLGFFGASSVSEKRIFVSNVIEVFAETYCSPSVLRKGLREITPRDYPAYLMGDAERYYNVLLNNECVDCTVLRGINIKPAFWPK